MSAIGVHPLLAGSAHRNTLLTITGLVNLGARLCCTELATGQQARQLEVTSLPNNSNLYISCLLQDSICLDHEIPGSAGQHIIVCTASPRLNLLVFSSSGSPDKLKVLKLASLSCTKPLILHQERPACSCTYSSAAVSADGNYLAALCGPAQPYVEYWQLSPLQLLHSANLQPGHHGTHHFQP